MPSEILDLYQILGVAPGASESAIREAFRQRAKALHADHPAREAPSQSEKSTPAAPEDPEEIRLRALLSDWLVAALLQSGAPQFDDVLDLTRRSILLQIAKVEQQIAQLKTFVIKLTTAYPRFRTKGENNLVQELLLERQKRVEEGILGLENHRHKLVKILTILQDYYYENFDDTVL
jgi:hypothetical protein